MKTFRSLKIAAAIGAITTGMNSWSYPIYVLSFEDSEAKQPNYFFIDINAIDHHGASVRSQANSTSFLEITSNEKASETPVKDSFAQDDMLNVSSSSIRDSAIAQPRWLNPSPYSGRVQGNEGRQNVKLAFLQKIAVNDDLTSDLQSASHGSLIADAQSLVPADHRVARDWIEPAPRNLPTNISQGSGDRPAQVVASTGNPNQSALNAVVSEPGALNLIGMGVVGLAITRRFAKSKQKSN